MPPAPEPPAGEPVALPEGHTLSDGSFEVAAGGSADRGGVRFSCAAGGAACRVVVGADGAARSTGGELTVAKVMPPAPEPPAGEPVALPEGHTLSGGSFEVAAGGTADRGGVRFSCAAGGAACRVAVGADGAARSTGGRLTVAKVPAPAPQPPAGEPVALPEGHTLSGGSFEVAAGGTADRGGVRFSCAAGGAACRVVVGADGAARSTGGRLTVARIPAPAPQPPTMPQPPEDDAVSWPDWPIMNTARALELMGGAALAWTSDGIRNRIETHNRGGGTDDTDYGFTSGSGSAEWCLGDDIGDTGCLDIEYRPVMSYRNIAIVQGREQNGRETTRGPYEYEFEIMLGGIMDYGYFTVARKVWFYGNYEIGSQSHVYEFQNHPEAPLATGRWEGVLVGTGNTPDSPLHEQFIMGDVDIAVDLTTGEGFGRRAFDSDYRDVEVRFSNIVNINTGAKVTLSHMSRSYSDEYVSQDRRHGVSHLRDVVPDNPGEMGMFFLGPNDEEVLGTFYTEEALGSFGAKKK